MRKTLSLSGILILLIISFSACTGGGAGGGDRGGTVIPPPDPSISVDAGSDYMVETLAKTGDFPYTFSNSESTSKDVYFIFTNYTEYNSTVYPTVFAENTISLSQDDEAKNQTSKDNQAPLSEQAVVEKKISDKNAQVVASLQVNSSPASISMSTLTLKPSVISYNSLGDTDSFYDDVDDTYIDVTLQYTEIVNGKTLEIWVADDCFTGGTKTNLMNSPMVKTIAEEFMPSDGSNGIYHWVTDIFGSEWGDAYTNYNNLITPDNRIVIFFYDINNDNSTNGGVLGYFSSTHNLKNDPNSNPNSDECVRFAIDAVLMAEAVDTWDIDDPWPQEMLSTIAHEFQHVVHFYQKQVVQMAGWTDTWINEMCSLIAEDLLSKELVLPGPRGVNGTIASSGSTGNTNGRLPLYIYWPEESLTVWDGSSLDYSTAYSFGAFLARNYGGAPLFGNIVQNSYSDSRAITSQIPGETMESLLVKWGVAALLSDATDVASGLQYNKGAYFSASGFDLGSVNLDNYQYTDSSNYTQTGLWLYSGSGSVGIDAPAAGSNTHYYAGTIPAMSSETWDISLPEGVRLTVVIK